MALKKAATKKSGPVINTIDIPVADILSSFNKLNRLPDYVEAAEKRRLLIPSPAVQKSNRETEQKFPAHSSWSAVSTRCPRRWPTRLRTYDRS